MRCAQYALAKILCRAPRLCLFSGSHLYPTRVVGLCAKRQERKTCGKRRAESRRGSFCDFAATRGANYRLEKFRAKVYKYSSRAAAAKVCARARIQSFRGFNFRFACRWIICSFSPLLLRGAWMRKFYVAEEAWGVFGTCLMGWCLYVAVMMPGIALNLGRDIFNRDNNLHCKSEKYIFWWFRRNECDLYGDEYFQSFKLFIFHEYYISHWIIKKYLYIRVILIILIKLSTLIFDEYYIWIYLKNLSYTPIY